jgi:hypothetical protein
VGVTPPSAWPWLDHPVSGLLPATHGRAFRTRFRCASASRHRLAANRNSRTHYTKGTPSPRVSPRGLRLLVGVRFQVSFTPLVGVLFTFPSRYWCTIGRRGVFRLGGWSPHVRTGFHVPRPTRGSSEALTPTGLSPALADLSRSFGFSSLDHWPAPLSLATTRGISVDVFSSGY